MEEFERKIGRGRERERDRQTDGEQLPSGRSGYKDKLNLRVFKRCEINAEEIGSATVEAQNVTNNNQLQIF